MFSLFDAIERVANNHDFLATFPKILAHYEKMRSDPRILEYLIERRVR